MQKWGVNNLGKVYERGEHLDMVLLQPEQHTIFNTAQCQSLIQYVEDYDAGGVRGFN